MQHASDKLEAGIGGLEEPAKECGGFNEGKDETEREEARLKRRIEILECEDDD
jgi:hypothetical protein